MAFTKLNWVDEVRDEQGNVIQEGTSLSATNLNRFENGFEENANEIDKRFDNKVIEVDKAFEVQKGEVLKLIENKWDNEMIDVVFGDSGYYKLPNGLIIQWGRTSTKNNARVIFPITFPNKCLQVVANGAADDWNYGSFTPKNTVLFITNKGTTGVTFRSSNVNYKSSNVYTNYHIDYIAIGF